MIIRCLSGLTGIGLLLLSLGCAPPCRRAEIPYGEWSGTGTFVVDRWQNADKEGKSLPETVQHAVYSTSLTIERAKEDGQDVIRLEVLSQHGKLKDMEGDRTHLIANLAQRKSVADVTITLYALTKFGLALDEKAPDFGEGPEGLTHATCMTVGGDLILRIHYMEGFVDTFRFHGDRIDKDGSYFPNSNDGLIHWSETLQRKR